MAILKYFGAYTLPLLGILTFNSTGITAYIGLISLYIMVPILEIIFSTNSYNLNDIERKSAKESRFFDYVLFGMVPLHLASIYCFMIAISTQNLSITDLLAYILMMGTLLGVIGINLGHELGHKTERPLNVFLAHLLLTTSVQNHFMTYHNAGHHRDVATPNDLTSASKGDNFYIFALRSQIGGYFKTWKLESHLLKVRGKSTLANPMIVYTLLPILLFFGIYSLFGLFTMQCYFIASVLGISILEAQNYFAHYGLKRNKLPNGRYESVKPHHSWNSDHIIGRVLLFELTRHSDHHHRGAKPFQILDSKERSPLLPYGYPMMLMLSFIPFLFHPIMKKQLKVYGVH
jgi:alkane 1-monooxygenase